MRGEGLGPIVMNDVGQSWTGKWGVLQGLLSSHSVRTDNRAKNAHFKKTTLAYLEEHSFRTTSVSFDPLHPFPNISSRKFKRINRT